MRIVLVYILLILSTNASSQSLEIQASVDTNLALIGEQVNYTVHVKAEELQKITWPSIQDSLGGLEIIEFGKIDTTKNANWINYKQTITLTSFDSGYYVIPNLEIGIDQAKAYTQEIVLRYNTVQVEANKYMDIKGPKSAEDNTWIHIIVITSALLIIGIIILIYVRKKLNSSEDKGIKRQKIIPPHVIALDQLYQMRQDKTYLEFEQTKTFYSDLTECIRMYLNKRFGIKTLERVSDEIIQDLDRINLLPEDKEQITKILRHADAIKFAKGTALTHESEQYIELMIQFVNNTIPSPNPMEQNG